MSESELAVAGSNRIYRARELLCMLASKGTDQNTTHRYVKTLEKTTTGPCGREACEGCRAVNFQCQESR